MHNSFILQQYVCYITILNMFRAARCSSSGGKIVSPQPLVSSLSVNIRTVCRWRADCSPLSTCILYCCLQTVTIPEAVVIQFVLLRMSRVLPETRKKQLINSLGLQQNKHAVIIRDTFVLCSRCETPTAFITFYINNIAPFSRQFSSVLSDTHITLFSYYIYIYL